MKGQVNCMVGNSVVVHDVDMLETFKATLQIKYDELEILYTSLYTETMQQESNWQDPQYEYLKTQVETYCSTCKTQMLELQESIEYINRLVVKLRNV